MGFTPLKAFIKGGAEFGQKVALMRLQGNMDLEKERAKISAKAIADAAGNTTVFQAGNVSLSFTDSGASDSKARNNENISNFYTVLGSDNYQKFIKAAKAEGVKGLAKIDKLNNFGKSRHMSWIDQNKFTEGDSKTAKVLKFADITAKYNEALEDGYGKEYLEGIVAPSYGISYERFQSKYPGKLGMLADKVIQPDGFIKYDHIPYMTKSFYDSQEGQKIIKDAKEVGTKLNMPYERVLSQWQVGLKKDDQANPQKQKVIWDIYRDLKANLGGNISDVRNVGVYGKFIANARKKAYDNGVNPTQFANMLSAFIPELGGEYVPDAFIYVDKATRKEIETRQSRKHLKSEYGIDVENANNKRMGADRASAIAGTIIGKIQESRAVVGPGGAQPLIGGLFQKVQGLFGEGGIFQGGKNYIAWVSGEKGFSTSATGRSLLNTRLQKAQKKMSDPSASEQDKRLATIEFLKFNLAYEMASAFQGGTGGRTISDQDIENMMNAMNFGAGTSEEAIVGSLESIRGIMQDVSAIQGMYAQGGKKAGVAYVLEQVNSRFGVDFANGNFADYAVSVLSGKKTSGYSTNKGVKKNPNWTPNSPAGVPKWITVPK